MPERDGDGDAPGLDEIADTLYGLRPEDFVPSRDGEVSAARDRGDRELARAIGRLRRPTRPAWLANLLARHRAEQIEGLVSLAAGLADAQRSLDGDTLRALSSQRHRAVAAMSREAGRLAQQAGSPATDAQLRELQGILEAALAQPAVAAEVRAGRLTRTLTYTGFGPEAALGTVPKPPSRPAGPANLTEPEPEPDQAAREQVQRQRAERDLAAAEQEAAAARAQQEVDESARDEARQRHAAARERTAELVAELESSRTEERAAADAVKAATAAARESARAATAAAAVAERARSHFDALQDGR